jgi:hypothetical protein
MTQAASTECPFRPFRPSRSFWQGRGPEAASGVSPLAEVRMPYLLWALLFAASDAAPVPSPSPSPVTPTAQEENETCLGCHADPGLTLTVPDGQVRSLPVDGEAFGRSVHGARLRCTDCHPGRGDYPHPETRLSHASRVPGVVPRGVQVVPLRQLHPHARQRPLPADASRRRARTLLRRLPRRARHRSGRRSWIARRAREPGQDVPAMPRGGHGDLPVGLAVPLQVVLHFWRTVVTK